MSTPSVTHLVRGLIIALLLLLAALQLHELGRMLSERPQPSAISGITLIAQ